MSTAASSFPFQDRLQIPRPLHSAKLKMPELKPYKGDYYLWEYVPNIGASVVSLLLFIGTTGFHCWKAWQTKARFCIAFCFGGTCE